jgi:DNA-binding response OmpR family regulator
MNSAMPRDTNDSEHPSRRSLVVERTASEQDAELEELDRRLAEVLTDRAPSHGPANILIVGGEEEQAGLVDWLKQRRHRCVAVDRLDAARAAVARRRFDLVMLDPHLPDGDGFELPRLVRQTSTVTKTIVFSEDLSARTAVEAMRCGAVDYLASPIEYEALARHIDAALIQSRLEAQREDRINRLKRICRDLNVARHEISEQVDGLCNDLVTAYREVADHVSEVAMVTEFRTLLRQELDVEEMLRTTLEYLLSRTGPTNAAVYLPDSDRNYALGAYVNYDRPRESMTTLLDHLCQAICPQMEDEQEIVSFDDAEEFSSWIGLDADLLESAQVVAFSCHDGDDCLAVVVLFRSRSEPFGDDLPRTLDLLRAVIGEQLGSIIRVHHRATGGWPKQAESDEQDFDDEFGLGFGEAAA